MAARNYIFSRFSWSPIRAWPVGAALAALVTLAAVDISLPEDANVSGALVVVPFLTATAGSPRKVGGIGLAAIMTAIGLAFADGSGPHASATRIIVIILGTMIATQMAASRRKREQALVDISTVAEVVQRAIMSQPRPVVGSVAVAVRYQSSTRAANVGGDCFEALDTKFGTRLLLGDVRGHGLPAVRLSALVVGAFRAQAYLESDLAVIARNLDGLVAQQAKDPASEDLDGEEFVTAILVESNQDRVTIANCGHPPPLLVRSDGHVTVLGATMPTVPLALGSQPRLDTITVEPGVRLLLYTDGIVESRDQHGVFFGLQDAVAGLAAEPLESMLDALVEKLRRHANNQILDDVALLAFEPCTHLRQASTSEKAAHSGEADGLV